MIKMMERFPIIVVLGAGLIGWVAGETIASDFVFKDFMVANGWLHYAGAAAAAAFVVLAGKAIQARRKTAPA